MVYESSYESGRKPFIPDVNRGYWSSPSDFLYATIGLAFRLDIFSMSWFLFYEMGVSAIIPYIVSLFVYTVPMCVIQSFIGQFSSSGFISAFRISPIFKGLGYVALALNLSILTYYSLFAAVPFMFIFHSLRPTLPWSCEAIEYWAKNLTEKQMYNFCNMTIVDSYAGNSSEVTTETADNDTMNVSNSSSWDYIGVHIPSAVYFRNQFGHKYMELHTTSEFEISWEIVGFTLLTWAIIAGIFYKFFHIEKFGKILRYFTLTIVCLMIVCIIRFTFHSGGLRGTRQFFMPGLFSILHGGATVPVYSLTAFGAGWGAIISLSSFNKFKTNIMRYSWIMCLGQMFVFLGFIWLTIMVESYFEEQIPEYEQESKIYKYVETYWTLYMSSASAMATMEFPNLWTILYYAMMALAALTVMITQIYSIAASLFDEFEGLRTRKPLVIFSMIGFLALSSLYFCTSHGIEHFGALSIDSVAMQAALNLLLILVVLWIYGRIRFQRDIEFMLGQRFSTWRVQMLRFLTTLWLALTLLILVLLAIYEHSYSVIVMHIFTLIFIIIPWLSIPAYIIYILLQTTGSIKMRFQRCSRPNDWYPVETEERQRYEEAMENTDITHQLQEVQPEVY